MSSPALKLDDSKPAILRRWQPKRWEQVYTEIVILATSGMSNKELALKYHYTEVHISNIIRTPQASLIRQRLLDNVLNLATQSIPERLEATAHKAVQRIQAVIDDDKLAQENPFAVFDRSVAVLKGVGTLQSEASTKKVTNNIIISETGVAQLRNAMALSDKAKLLNPPDDLEDAEIVTDQE